MLEVEGALLHRAILRKLRQIAGVLLVIVGIAGLILPIMPGWIFLAPGIALLGPDNPFVKRWMAKGEEWRDKFKAWLRRSKTPEREG
jgi:uncharacterized membrane protein YbaN (DUF454 family)